MIPININLSLQSNIQSEKQLNYWKQQLADASLVLELPTDRPRPPVQKDEVEKQSFILHQSLSQALYVLSQQEDVTVFSTLLAAFQTLLYRYSRQEDILVGCPVMADDQQRTETKANTLVLRSRMSGNPSFQDLLQKVHSVVLEARANQDLPFEKLVEELQIERSLSYHPLFQVMFVLQTTPKKTSQSHTSIDLNKVISNLDLTLSMEETEQGLQGAWEYNIDLFNAETIARMSGHFQTLLEQIVANPQQHIDELPLLTATERQQLLVEWNNTQADYPQHCVHEFFEVQASKTPDAVAVVFEEEQLTYRELNNRANQLAHYLRTLGVRPDVLVGICVRRSLEMIVGLLGILKAGGAYVPIDPDYPYERIAYMLADSQLPILLTQKQILEKLPEHQAQTICLDEDWHKFADYSQNNPCSEIKSDNLAYIIYTSGSTGKPKGTMIVHSGMVNYLSWCTKTYNVADGEGSTVNSSIGFDATITSLFSPLFVGRKVVLLPEKDEIEALKTALCSGTKFSLVKITPAHLEILSHLLSDEPVVNIQTQAFIIGGEALSEKVTSFWQQKAPSTKLINEYGPTETVVGCSIYEVGKQTFPGGNIPVGRPIANTQLYILDKNLQPVPIGVVGELYIAGAGVARGYLNRPELTQEKFISNPFSQEEEARLYKTGDLGRYLPDGNIEYLGRIDHQVKIRGFRIELGEIETVVSQHPSVLQTVVIAREDVSGNKRLVAYVVVKPEQVLPTPSQLRDFAKEQLPDYMLPSTFVFLDTLPLTPNGKVDRRALPAPNTSDLIDTRNFVAPRTSTEEMLAAIWSQVLGLERIGIHDNFFELGGHSLLATQVISRLRQAFGVEISLQQLFETPTIAGLASAIATLQNQGTNEHLTIPRRANRYSAPLSYVQQQLWFLAQLKPDSAAYNIVEAMQLQGDLKVDVLQKSLDAIVVHHEALRTNFIAEDGNPVQVISEPRSVEFKVIDLKDCPLSDRTKVVQQQLQDEAQRPFNLASDLMLRACLFELSPQEHILMLVMHHIATDGWSISILFEQLTSLYKAFTNHLPNPQPELPIQFADYVVWQRQCLEGEVLDKQLSYWKQHLANATTVLELPTDRQRPPVHSFRGATQYFEIPQSLSQALNALSRQEGVTLFMTLLAAFQTLLYRYTGQQDILVGSPIAGRNCTEVENLIGFFVNTLVLRTDLSGNPSFQQLLQRVREMAISAYVNQDVPFEKLVEELQPERSLAYNPFFQVLFVLQNAPKQTLELSGLSITPLNVDNSTSKFDLTLAVEPTEQGLRTMWQYNTDLFDAATINRMYEHFQTLLAQIVAQPQQHINELPFLSATERQQLLVEWNNTQADYPQHCVHELFEVQASKTPDAVAVVFEEEQLTYQQLNHRANQLAHYLTTLGVGPEVLVALYVERSLDMIIGLLGILKAGGVYLPLDPALPTEGLAFRLQDAQVPVLVTQARLIESLSKCTAQVVCLDKDLNALAKQPNVNPKTLVTPENLIYVLYTSGSTGRPKGVAVEHRQILNYLNGILEKLNLSTGASFATLSTFAADLGNTVIFPSLCTGGCLHIISQERATNPVALADYCRSNPIDCLKIVPSHLAALLASPDPEQILPHQCLVIGGEAITWELIEQIRQYADCRILNHYGPTEATVGVLTYPIEQRGSQSPTVPLGRPLPNNQIYLLDKHRQLVPFGVQGEIYIGGDNLARGYLNQPILTVERFIPNPFSDLPGARLYKTGDLARYLPDGNIEFLGRSDYQVKIRGFRIELGEIEAILGTHPAVLQTLVMAREDVPGNKRLVAYVVVKPEQLSPNVSELCGFLKEQLLEYMVPAAFVFLDAMPLTLNGKIDRHALPVPSTSDFISDKSYVAPRNPTEEILNAIWEQVLGLERVSIHDNFFELGGHSLLAMQVNSRIHQAFGVEIPLQLLFESPTIADLASAITSMPSETRKGRDATRTLSFANALSQKQGTEEHQTIARIANRQSAPLSFAQQRLWFLAQLEPDSAAYNLVKVTQLLGDLNIGVLQQSLNAIVAHHEVLRTNFIAFDGEPVQVIRESWSVDLKVIDLKDYPESKRTTVVQQLLQNETQRPFNLASDLMLRACLLVISPQEHILLLVMHHIASDGWSKSILSEQLTSLYQAFRNSLPNPLPELPIQYVDYAVWQRQWLESGVLEKQLNYWKQQLLGATPVLELPTDKPRPPVQSYRGAKQSFVLPQSLSKALNALSRQESVTLFMTLLAVFQTLLYRYSGQQDILVGSPIAGRHRAEIEGLIGFFVNTLVLRTDLSGNPSFRKLLQRVRMTAMAAYTHQDLPFEKLVEELQPERSLSYNPLFQVMFVLQNTPKQKLELPGLSITSLDVDKLTSQLDLTLAVEHTEQGLRTIWEYSTDLFDAPTITRMSEHFQTLLEQIVANPQQHIDELPLLTATERQKLLVEWNNAQADYPQHCVHEFFEVQSSKTPDAVAVVFEDQQLTYRELNNRANQLAHYLRTLGVGTDVLVGICVERSLEMVIGLLGILKAGGAYVPLDPEYPKERLAFVLEDTKTPVMLTQEKLVQSLPVLGAQIVCLDSDWQAIAQHSQENPVSGVTVDNLVYVIYTSGSTGKPKGVMIPHRGICNALYWRQATFKLTEQDKILQTISLSFDPSVWQIFWPLSFGGQLIVARPGGHKDSAYLVKEVVKQQITVLGLVPSIIQALLEEKGFKNCQSLRHATTGGEALPVELMERFFACLNLDNVLVNCYGPTEASIDVTTWICQRVNDSTIAPIGRPITNVQVYILDDNLQPVPIGHSGELYVGGSGLARGYLNRPELTEEKFIPNPFSSEAGARLYKTGDLARYLPDGNIEFLGRIDHQVKMRGFRIELGEIEATLGTHPALQQTLVMVREDVPGKKGLVAYSVAHLQQVPPSPSELRGFLKDKLPDYMVPAAFVMLDAMPLNPNGKVDRRALPAPDASHFIAANNFVAPRTPTEETLAAIWAQVLGLEQVGIYNNFFELGGHSLLATQVISRVREAFSIDIQLQLLFQTPIIADLAEAIVQIQAENTEDDEINRFLTELEDLSDEEAQSLLAEVMQ